jgi:sulfur carrier protein
MKIKANNEDVDLKTNGLLELLNILRITEKKGIAIAVNDVVVSKNEWDEFALKDEDQVIIIEAAQGG